jgi:hypothetical protein
MEKEDLAPIMINQEIMGIIDGKLDLEIRLVDLARHCMQWLGVKKVSLGDLSLDYYTGGWARAIRYTAKGDVEIQMCDECSSSPEWLMFDSMGIDDMAKVCTYLNATVQMKPEKPKKRKTVKKRTPRTRIDPVTFESRMRGEQ